jgi:hypothetical protein
MTIKHWDIHKSIVGSANALTEVVFQNEDSFMLTFCPTNYMDLIDVYFSGIGVKYYYIGIQGQHFVDDISNRDFQKWLEELK